MPREPFSRLFTQGMIRMDGKKMSKSRGNLVAPARYFDTVGADALRLFHLFAGPPGDDMDWTDQTDNVIEGCGRFLDRVWRLTVEDRRRRATATATRTAEDVEVERATHRLIAKVSDDFERWSFNTAVAACMEFVQRSAALPPRRPGRPAPGDARRRRRHAAAAARPDVPACHRRGVGAPARRRGHRARRGLAVVRPRAGPGRER